MREATQFLGAAMALLRALSTARAATSLSLRRASQPVRHMAAAGPVGYGSGPYRGVKIPKVAQWHKNVRDLYMTTMWLWLMWRAKNDGPALLVRSPAIHMISPPEAPAIGPHAHACLCRPQPPLLQTHARHACTSCLRVSNTRGITAMVTTTITTTMITTMTTERPLTTTSLPGAGRPATSIASRHASTGARGDSDRG